MTLNQIEACDLILKEHLGDVSSRIGTYLMKKGPTPLKVIAKEISLPVEQAKKGLYTLIQHNLAEFKQHKRGYVNYSVDHNLVLRRVRFPKYIYSAKMLYKDPGELIIEELLTHGQFTMLELIEKVLSRLNEAYNGEKSATKHEVYESFTNLAGTQFIQRCAELADDVSCPTVVLEEEDTLLYYVPTIQMEEANRKRKRSDVDDSEQPNKRLKSDNIKENKSNQSAYEKAIFWKINYSRFHHYLRDQVLINAVVKKFDKRAGEILRSILRISEVKSNFESPTTNPISVNEIHDKLNDSDVNRQLIEQYLTVMADDSCDFITKIGDSGGGMYSLEIKKAFYSLAKAHIESVVQERFGSKCLRIFRLLILKKHLEQKEIEEFAMIPAKEAKQLLYKMFGDHFVSITEVPKTPDHAPSRTFYLFSVDLNAISRMLLDMSYKALSNVILRRQHETKEHKRLLDKQQRVDAIALSLEQGGAEASQKEEVEEMITPPERTQINKVKHMTSKLEQSELQLDETIFVLQMYLQYVKS